MKLKRPSCADWGLVARAMHRGAWHEALVLLEKMPVEEVEEHTRSGQWQAKCLLKLGQAPAALKAAGDALALVEAHSFAELHWRSKGQRLNWGRWLVAQALVQADELSAALGWVASGLLAAPDHHPLRRMLAELLCKVHGDWSNAGAMWQKLKEVPGLQRHADWFAINRQIYCGAKSADSLTEAVNGYAHQYLAADGQIGIAAQRNITTQGEAGTHSASRASPVRKRVGLVSTLFCSSPVYFMCIGSLRLLAAEFDLVFFSRASTGDWATDAFRSIASEWHEVDGLSALELADRMRRSRLDVVIDMTGWIDASVLQAIAYRPAPRQFKWVGGQSVSTGLSAFDGYVSDAYQTPSSSAHLYAETLALLPGGYVTYTDRDDAPGPVAPDPASLRRKVGVVAHPMKLSPAFLAYLGRQIRFHQETDATPVSLEFIGWRFAEPRLQHRIHEALGGEKMSSCSAVTVSFVPTNGHREQLRAVADLDWVVDTFPYTGGVTVLEALSVGVPVRTHAGVLCSARHGYSHSRFAGLAHEDIDLQSLGAFRPSTFVKTGKTLLPAHCARKDHGRLASDLAKLLHGRSAGSVSLPV